MKSKFIPRETGEVGEIIYPAYNGTSGFWKKPRWDLITRVDKKGNILDIRYIWDIATVDAIEILQKFANIKFKEKK